MLKASIRLELGRSAKEYIKVMDKEIEYKRSSIALKPDGDSLIINIDAEDQVALFASMNSVMKQLRIIGSVDKKIDELE